MFAGNLGTSKFTEQFWNANSNLGDIDLLAFNGNIVLDSGEYNCMCLWDNFFQNLRLYWARRKRIIPMMIGIGEFDTGLSYMTKDNSFLGEFHSSNFNPKSIPAIDMFPQSIINGVYTYNDYGVAAIRLYDSPTAKNFYLISMDPGVQISSASLKSKEIFRTIKDDDIVIVMWSASIHPGCKYSKWLFDVSNARHEWELFFSQYADIVVEGGGSFKSLKRYRDVNNLNDNVQNTVYVGDTYISGAPPSGTYDEICIQEKDDDALDKYRFKEMKTWKQAQAWYIDIKTNILSAKASLDDADVAFDQFNIKI